MTRLGAVPVFRAVTVSPSMTGRGHNGSATLVVAAVLMIAVLTTLAVGKVNSAVLQQRRAEAIADVTALASVSFGPESAAEVANANQASISSIRLHGTTNVVEIQLFGHRASAAAAPSTD